MIILSWNIQKITHEKAAQFAPLIGNVINAVTGGESFVLVIYENKTNPDEVLNAIGTGINASGLQAKWMRTGGGSSVSENLLLISGNGATFDTPALFTDWHDDFDTKCKQLHDKEIRDAESNFQRLNETRPGRSHTQDVRNRALQLAEKGSFRSADYFRDPIMVTVRDDAIVAKFLALHAPGPSSGDEHEEPFARTYAEAVLHSAGGFDMIIGDFNLRNYEIDSGGFVDQSVRLGATTKGSEVGRHTYSRLDRAYTRPGFGIATALLSDGQKTELTDHHCLAIKVGKQPEQRTITSYFPYAPSPIRQQQVIYENYELAFGSRTANLQPSSNGMDV